jgi:glycosyltransferase involved in cell wall biosynthesis
MSADAVGGVWRYTIDLCSALADRGVRATVAVMGPPPAPAQRAEAEHAGIGLVDRPYRLEWMDEPWDDVRRAGGWLLALERMLRPDVVHLNGYAHAALPWAAPVVVVAHSCVRTWWRAVKSERPPDRTEPYRRAVAAGLAAARVVVAPSAAMLQGLRDEYGPVGECRVIPNGTAGRRGAPRSAKEPIVLAAGRAWDEAKNIAALCRVAGRVAWPICVAGDRCEPGKGERVLPSVRALGPLSTAELAGWYGRASIYALPARYEPFGLSVLEAAGAGCALVLGDIPSLRENWSGAAEFVPPDDAERLAAAIEGLISDRARRARLARRAAERAAAFTVDRTAGAYLDVYDAITA